MKTGPFARRFLHYTDPIVMGEPFMRVLVYLFALVLSLLTGGVASAQESRGWFGADVLDVTKAEADKLGWDAAHGAKLGVVAAGSPADKAGLKAGEIVDLVDGVEVETSSAFEKTIAAKSPGSEIRLRVLSGGRERRIAVTLAEPPKIQPTQDQGGPLLMLDTGGHMAKMTGLTFTPDGKQLVSAGDDKVIRVWDWEAGKTIRTIRGQVGPGHEGKIFAMALSPDGRWLAAAGWMDSTIATTPCCGDIRLYDFATGKLVALLKGHTAVVNSLAFSPDSKRLISGGGLGDLSAIIWDVEGRKSLHRLQGHKAEICAVAFAPNGERVVTGSYDATLRLWRVSDGGLIAEMKGHMDKVSRALAIRSSDGMIASGDYAGEIRLWDGNTGRFVRTLANQGGEVGSLRFSPDGKLLLSTFGECGSCSRIQHVWNVATGEDRATHATDENFVYAAAISPDGKLAATGGGNKFKIGVWELATGAPVNGPQGKPVVLAGTSAPSWAAAFSADGKRIGWGNTWRTHTTLASNPLQYQLRLPAPGSALGRPEPLGEAAARGFVRARVTLGDLTLLHRKGGAFGYDAFLDIKQGDKVIASMERDSTNGYRHLAYSFTPDGQTIISGGAGVLTAYDLKGYRLGDFVGHESDIWAVTPSPDGKFLVSGSADQTVRLWNLKTRELIVTLFNGTDGEWVMWTPQGYYTGSPGADKIVGWQINKGSDQVPDYVGADQLRDHLNRPDIVEKAIILASAEQAVREAPGTTFKLADLLARPVPRFKILSPRADEVQRGGRAVVRIAIESTSDPIKAIRVQVNGREIGDVTPDIGSGGFAGGERMLVVPLARGKNEVRITLTNAIGEKAEALTLNHEGEGALDKRGTLYILAIGVDKYPRLGNTCGILGDKSCNLTVSGADARSLVAAVEKRLGPAHDKIVRHLLINGAGGKDEPTATNILDAIDTLKQAEETDTVLLFVAGHGINEGPNYRFLATNAEWAGDALRGSTVVPWQILQEAVEGAKGRRILFIDTCHSGNAYNQRLGNAAYHANIIAYTAARFDQTAKEDDKLGHGLFTYAVVEGLEGKGGIGAHRQISTKELADYVIKRVEELAKAQNASQEPQYFKGRDAEDYVLAKW
jgi:WD40 repeat protein